MAEDPCTEEFFKEQSSAYQQVRVLYKKKSPASEETEEGGATTTTAVREAADKACESALEAVEAALSTLSEDHPQYCRVLGMRATLAFERGRLAQTAEQREEADRVLTAAMDQLASRATRPEVCFVLLRLVNHLAYNLATREELDGTLTLLEQGESVYYQLRTTPTADEGGSSPIPYYTADDLFAPSTTIESKPETAERLERLVTNNFQMMTYVYSRTERDDLYIAYQNRVLNRQLQMKEGDAVSWASKTIRLALTFLQKLQFVNARTHLAAASDILQDYNADVKKMAPSEGSPQRLQLMDYQVAELGRTWVKYALTLFSSSKHHLIERIFNETQQGGAFFEETATAKEVDSQQCLVCGEFEPEERKAEETSEAEKEDDKNGADQEIASVPIQPEDLKPPDGEEKIKTSDNKETAEGTKDEDEDEKPKENDSKINEKKPEYDCFIFQTLDLSYIESRVQADYVKNTKEARQLFLFTQPWLKRMMAYYNLNEHPAEYVNCILDLSELYRYLAFFEENMEAQYNVQKRRADTLETLGTVLREGNPACYVGASVELYRELAEVQIEMLGLNLRRLYAADCSAEAAEGMAAAIQPSDRIEWESHKLEAVKDIHGRLEEFKSYLAEADGQENEDEEDEEEEFTETFTEETVERVDAPVSEAGDVTVNVVEKDVAEPICIDTDSSGDASTVCKVPTKDEQIAEVESTTM